MPKIASAGVELFTALTKNLPQILYKILQSIPEIGKAIVKAFTERHPEIAEAGFALFTKIVEKGKEIIAEVKNFVGNLVDSVVSVVSGSFQSFYNVGYDIVTGIWNGISSGWGWLTSQVSSIAHNLLQAAKDALGIHSPSAVFRDEVGKMMAAGIGEGFNAETPKQFQRIKGRLSAEEKKLSASVTNNSTTNKSVSLGGIVVNINGGVQSAADARRYGNEIAETIQRELRYKGVLQLA